MRCRHVFWFFNVSVGSHFGVHFYQEKIYVCIGIKTKIFDKNYEYYWSKTDWDLFLLL